MAISRILFIQRATNFPNDVQDKRRELLPAKKSAIRNSQRAVFSYDKFYIDGVLFKLPVNQKPDNTNDSGGHRTPGRPNDTFIPGGCGQSANNRFSLPASVKPKTPHFS